MKKQLFYPILIILAAALSAACLGGCIKTASVSPLTRTGFAFDTVISITIYDSQKSYVLDQCLDLCEKYENLFSVTLEGSDIWNINHQNGAPVAVSYETASLIQSALYYCGITGGVLDLTLLPVADEWHISDQMAHLSEYPEDACYIPPSEKLNELLEHVNYKNVVIYDDKGKEVGCTDRLSEDIRYSVALLDEKCAIDLGFIAKGYIADELKKYMLSEGIDSGIISLGGNILLIGSRPGGSPFHIGIQKPFGSRNEIITTVEETDRSVVSSGCYERYFISETDKKRTIYHHIFDTTTGCPVQNDLLSVTVISGSSLQGDALSTYCYILGADKGLAYIRSLDNVDAVFVTTDYEILTP